MNHHYIALTHPLALINYGCHCKWGLRQPFWLSPHLCVSLGWCWCKVGDGGWGHLIWEEQLEMLFFCWHIHFVKYAIIKLCVLHFLLKLYLLQRKYLVPAVMLYTFLLSEQDNGLFGREKNCSICTSKHEWGKETVPDDLLYLRAWHCLIPDIWACKGIGGHEPWANLSTFNHLQFSPVAFLPVLQPVYLWMAFFFSLVHC